MEVQGTKYCVFCGLPIATFHRWVRFKEPGSQPERYLYYHAEPFPGFELSCWEREQNKEAKAYENVT